jgi:hypothetical protein
VHKHKNNKTKKKKKGSPAKANSSSIKKEKPNRFFSNKYTKKKKVSYLFFGFCLSLRWLRKHKWAVSGDDFK